MKMQIKELKKIISKLDDEADIVMSCKLKDGFYIGPVLSFRVGAITKHKRLILENHKPVQELNYDKQSKE